MNWHLFVPKTIVCLREGYDLTRFRKDMIAGLTVAVVALPLSMALAIASGTTPERGLITAIIAGFLISLLGGCRHQIGGPTGAFVVVVYTVIHQFGYDGLVQATLMAGVLMIVFGLFQLGTLVKYIPYPLVTGFTTGIAVIIFSSQVRDFLGLPIEKLPSDVIEQWHAYGAAAAGMDPGTLMLGIATLGIIALCRRFRPNWPAFLIGITAAAAGAHLLQLPVATIGSRFGGIPSSIPMPSLPKIDPSRFRELSSPALTIALLASIESLLPAVVADGMTGRRHKSNCELVAQGVGNIASVCCGGIPATGAIARTATNIRAGAQTPLAGMLHAVFLLLFMLLLAPLASFIPLASLAAVLFVVAFNMAEFDKFAHLLRAPRGDVLLLLITFLLTIFVDLSVAIQVGIVLSALIFMRQMIEATGIESASSWLEEDIDDIRQRPQLEPLPTPEHVRVFEITGPLFFGVVSKLTELLDHHDPTTTRVYILRMRNVRALDATGIHSLRMFVEKSRRLGVQVVLSGVHHRPMNALRRMRFFDSLPEQFFARDIQAAIILSHDLLHPVQPEPQPTQSS